MLTSPYLAKRSSDSHARSVIDLILVDRLGHLADLSLARKITLSPEFSLTAHGEDYAGRSLAISGRSDWALGYGKPKTSETILIAVVAKGEGEAFVGLPQLIVYMAASFQARDDPLKHANKAVFGILSDGMN